MKKPFILFVAASCFAVSGYAEEDARPSTPSSQQNLCQKRIQRHGKDLSGSPSIVDQREESSQHKLRQTKSPSPKPKARRAPKSFADKDVFAVLSLIAAILAITLLIAAIALTYWSYAPYPFAIPSLLFAVLALIFGLKARKRNGERGRGLAIAGLVMGFLVMLIYILWLLGSYGWAL